MSWFADTASWALILGVLTPLAVALVQQPRWSARWRAVVAAVAALAVGVVTVLANGGFNDASGALGIIALVLVASNTAYKTLWKPTGVAPALEAATSPRGRAATTAGGYHRNEAGQIPAWVVWVLAVIGVIAIIAWVL